MQCSLLNGVIRAEICIMTIKQKKQLAFSLYIKTDQFRKEIAEQVGVTEKTLRSWIDKGDWDNIKDAETITRSKLLQDAYKQLAAINQKITDDLGGIPDKQLSDAKGVIRKEIEALSEMPLHKYIEVVTDLLNYVKTHQPEKIIDAVDITDAFVQNLFAERGV